MAGKSGNHGSNHRHPPDAEGFRPDGSFFDPDFNAYAIPITLGEWRVGRRQDDMVTTMLGSCIAACIHDPVAGVGGMNHFLLPGKPGDGDTGVAARYGAVAMDGLLAAVVEAGGWRERLEVKLFGGARLIDSGHDIGAENAAFALDYVTQAGVRLTGRDLGGTLGRRVMFFPATGRAYRRFLLPDMAGVEGEVRQWRRARRKSTT